MRARRNRGEVKGPEAKVLIASRVWGSAWGSVRAKASGSLSFSLVPLEVMRRIVEAEVAK